MEPVQVAPPLAYAPPAKSPNRKIWVFAAGIGTTVATLIGVYVINAYFKSNVMGLYVNGFLPVGALLVGAAASAGYGIVSYTTGVRIRRGLMVAILVAQGLAYWVAQYAEFAAHGPLRYSATGQRIGFVEYFQLETENMAWSSTRSYDHSPPIELGKWGYLVRFGEFAGFVLGGLIAPLGLMKAKYCDLCEAYMKSDLLVTVPAGGGAAFLPKFGKAKAEQAASAQAAMEEGAVKIGEVVEFGRRGDATGMRAKVAEIKAQHGKAHRKPRKFQVSLVRCPQCSSGHLRCYLTVQNGNRINHTELGTMELTQEFIREWRAKRA